MNLFGRQGPREQHSATASLRRAARLVVAAAMLVGLAGVLPSAWAQDDLFVTNFSNNSVTVYTGTADGNVAPLRTIAGGATGLNGPIGLAVDTVNNELAVVNNAFPLYSVTVYALTANGNVAPMRTIAGAATGLINSTSVAVDTVNNELIVVNVGTTVSDGSITVYPRTANGNVAPSRTISGAATGLSVPQGLALDTVNNELVVGNAFDSVTVYARTANGNVAPLRTVSGAATGLDTPFGVAVDTVNNELAVTNQGNDSVTVYARTATGNAAPLRTLAGGATGLDQPFGLTVDTVNNELVVPNFNGNDVTVYDRTATGNAFPLRTLEGAATGLNGPFYVAITSGPPSLPPFRNLAPGISIGPDLGGTGHTAVNVTGAKGAAGGTWIAVYDSTPSDPTTKDLFGSVNLSADVMITTFNNGKGAGLLALYNESVGKEGLALIVNDADNTDTLVLSTVDQAGTLGGLKSVSLAGGINEKQWYRLTMNVVVSGGNVTVTGQVFRHTTPTDPTSALGAQVGGTLSFTGPRPSGVDATGEVGIVASAKSAVVDSSVTNFTINGTTAFP